MAGKKTATSNRGGGARQHVEPQPQEWLNYHHLLYFWTVARLGSVTAASAELRLAQPTISGQIRTLEDTLGEKLFERAGRNLVLTDTGRLVFRYADEIFSLGRELLGTLRGRPTGRPHRLHVGISDVVPKHIAHRILSPALRLEEAVQLVCIEDKSDRLLAELAVSGLDMVLADQPIAGQARISAFNHVLGQCGVTILACEQLAATYGDDFPACLDGAPMLLPTDDTMLRRALEQWFDRHDIRPATVGEFDDSALVKIFAREGAGLCAVPSVIEAEVRHEFDLHVVGRTDEVVERFYLISVERRVKNPAVAAIIEQARSRLFSRT